MPALDDDARLLAIIFQTEGQLARRTIHFKNLFETLIKEMKKKNQRPSLKSVCAWKPVLETTNPQIRPEMDAFGDKNAADVDHNGCTALMFYFEHATAPSATVVT